MILLNVFIKIELYRSKTRVFVGIRQTHESDLVISWLLIVSG